jgi:hypothetical protein
MLSTISVFSSGGGKAHFVPPPGNYFRTPGRKNLDKTLSTIILTGY